MKIALTGTPGTGKTTVVKILKEKYFCIDLNALILNKKFHFGKDKKRDSYIVDIDKLDKHISKISYKKDMILEGHISHLLNVDVIIVLRANPFVLRNRLLKRKYSIEKLNENLESEALDVILVESIEKCEKVYEIDTTDKKPQEVAVCFEYIVSLLKKDIEPKNFLPGNIDWLNFFKK